MFDDEFAPQPPPKFITDEVTHRRCKPSDSDQRDERNHALAGDDTTDDHRRLTGRDQSDESSGLKEGQHADEQVGPVSKRCTDAGQQLFEVW